MADTTLFLAISFGLFVVGVLWKGKSLFHQTVDGYIHAIENEFQGLQDQIQSLQKELDSIPESWTRYQAYLKLRQDKHMQEKLLFREKTAKDELCFTQSQKEWFESQWRAWIREWSLHTSEKVFEAAIQLLPLNPSLRQTESIHDALASVSQAFKTHT